MPLAGGSQNVVVRLRIDGRRLVLRRPPPHPRPNSDRTMQREIAVLRTLAGSAVPHPAIVAACEDLDVLGVVFYLMEEVDGFNPGNEIAGAYVRDPVMRHRVGLNYAADVARLSRASWEGSPLAEWKRPGSFWNAKLPQWRSAVAAYRAQDGYDHHSLPGSTNSATGWRPTGQPATCRESCTATSTSTTPCCAAGNRRWRPSSTGRCAPWGPAIGSGLDAGVLAGSARSAGVGRVSGRTGGWRNAVNCWRLTGGRRPAHRSSRLVSGAGLSETRRGHRRHLGAPSGWTGDPGGGSGLHNSAVTLMGLGTAVAGGGNPFT